MAQEEVCSELTRPLTRRQHECVELVTKGLSSKEIARELGIAPSTVDNHIAQVMHQLGIPNRATLRAYSFAAPNLVSVNNDIVVDTRTKFHEELAAVRPLDSRISVAKIVKLRNSILVFSGVSYIALAVLIIFSTLITVYMFEFYRG